MYISYSPTLHTLLWITILQDTTLSKNTYAIYMCVPLIEVSGEMFQIRPLIHEEEENEDEKGFSTLR